MLRRLLQPFLLFPKSSFSSVFNIDENMDSNLCMTGGSEAAVADETFFEARSSSEFSEDEVSMKSCKSLETQFDSIPSLNNASFCEDLEAQNLGPIPQKPYGQIAQKEKINQIKPKQAYAYDSKFMLVGMLSYFFVICLFAIRAVL